MNRDTDSEDAHALLHRKTRDRALILPLMGLILLTPPVAGIFELDVKLVGVPFTIIYLFTVWAGMILGTALLARRLRAGTESAEGPRSDPPPKARSSDG